MDIQNIIKVKKNIILVGEVGCGKTELSINIANDILNHTQKNVVFFDMDQTKTMFRARDLKKYINEKIEFICGESFLDSPLVAPSVIAKLKDENTINILDIGGNEVGAVTLGQYSKFINKENTIVLFLINPYRLLSHTSKSIKNMIENIKNASKINDVFIISNPNFGKETDKEIIKEGVKKLDYLLEKINLKSNCLIIPNWIKDKDLMLDKNIYKINPNITYV